MIEHIYSKRVIIPIQRDIFAVGKNNVEIGLKQNFVSFKQKFVETKLICYQENKVQSKIRIQVVTALMYSYAEFCL